ncbi:hypothetical protein [Vibrio tarriae]|uniref:hypothetical protein n=1 Tax=Vibrio tarriae TaxID=2014742 RepID=UPI000DE2EB06|nr:hypothetical protein [Vibrio tarriae]RBM54064.1 hypothetical protein DLR64_05495 [Vibrio tarriae]
MQLFFKRLGIYWLCFFISYFPYRQAQALAPAVGIAGAVVLDIIAGAVIDKLTGDVSVPAVCGKKPWAANDPVFLCDARSPKSTWLGKVKTSAKWSALLFAAGYFINSSNINTVNEIGWQTCNNISGRTFSDCLSLVNRDIASGYYDSFEGAPYVIFRTTFSNGLYTVYFDIGDSGKQLTSFPTHAVYQAHFSSYSPVSDEKFYNNFWQTSPVVTPDTWLPEAAPAPQYHPDPGWFPSSVPVSVPMTPSPKPENDPTTYPKPLPSTHPDSRPSTTPKPDYTPEYWPVGDPLPGSWPVGWPAPGQITSPGDFPQEWPLPGSTPLPKPGTNPDPDPNPNPNPDPSLPFPIPLPVIGPLTRTELEAVQAQNFSQADSALPTADFTKPQDDITQLMENFVKQQTDLEVPEFQFNPFGYFTFGGGGCISFNFTVSIGGKSFSLTIDDHCPPWEEYVRPTLEWALYLSTGLYIYILFTRTVRSM